MRLNTLVSDEKPYCMESMKQIVEIDSTVHWLKSNKEIFKITSKTTMRVIMRLNTNGAAFKKKTRLTLMIVISLGSPLSISSLQSIVRPEKLNVILGKPKNFTLRIKMTLKSDVKLYFIENPYVVVKPLLFKATTCEGLLYVHGRRPSNGHQLEIHSCTTSSSSVRNSECDIIKEKLYLEVVVLRSSLVDALVMIVGWSYFTAWSISSYPQILLNTQRKSVVGLNFDLLALNVVGYLTYCVYNLFMFANKKIQAQYHEAHPHSPIPVLLNDVFFAGHGLATCLATVGQCFIYKRGGQRVSFTCIVIMVILSLYALVSGLAMVCGYLNMLQFVTNLSFIKMAVTPLKYIPQAILNYRRKSTTGWSIGNRLLDFTGGCLGLLQMGLQCWNVADWTAFYGNPVKVGLSLVSLLFDILFMTQHYILYPQKRSKDSPSEEESKSTNNPDNEERSGNKIGALVASNSMSSKEQKNGNQRNLYEEINVEQKEKLNGRTDKDDAGQSSVMVFSAIS